MIDRMCAPTTFGMDVHDRSAHTPWLESDRGARTARPSRTASLTQESGRWADLPSYQLGIVHPVRLYAERFELLGAGFGGGSVMARKAVTQDSSPVAVSLRPSWAWGLASHFPGDPGNLSDTTSDRGLDKAPLDRISGVSKPLAQQEVPLSDQRPHPRPINHFAGFVA